MIAMASELFTTYIEALLGYLLLYDAFRGKGKTFALFISAAVNTAAILLINRIQVFSYFPVIVAVALTAVIISLLLRVNFFKAVCFSVAYSTAVHMLDFIWLSLWCVAFGNIETVVEMVTSASQGRIIFILSIKFLEIILFLFIGNRLRKITIDDRFYKYILFVSLMIYFLDSIVVSGFLSSSYHLIRVGIAVEWFWIGAMAIFLIYMAVQVTKFNNERKEYSFIEKKNSLLSENIENLSQNYHEISKNNHDFKHHLALIGGYIENENYGKALGYIKEINDGLTVASNVSYTGIETVDIVLNYKINQAQKFNIPVNINVNIKAVSAISDEDLCVMLSNAFDNAIEANEAVENKYININFTQENNIVIFKIENPTVNVMPNNGRLKTTKRGKNHGIGMKSIIQTAEKNNCVVDWEIKENKFILSITHFG